MSPPDSVEALLDAVRDAYDSLSRQLKAIARHVETAREQLALDGIQETARRCDVQPSAVVRFAQRFGFSGYSELQALFRAGATRQLAPGRDYEDRLRIWVGTGREALAPSGIAREVIAGGIESLQRLQRDLPDARFDAAVDLMAGAPALWLVANRRAFPVGAYLAYALQHSGKPVHWLSGLGHMQLGQLRGLVAGDLLVAVSFEPYASETLEVAGRARERGARLLALTDSAFSPLAAQADVSLLAKDEATFGFRSLTGTLCLAQSLFLGLAYRMQLAYEQAAPVQAPATPPRAATPERSDAGGAGRAKR